MNITLFAEIKSRSPICPSVCPSLVAKIRPKPRILPAPELKMTESKIEPCKTPKNINIFIVSKLWTLWTNFVKCGHYFTPMI